MSEQFLTITQVAHLLCVRERVIQHYVDTGEIPYRKVGKTVRFRASAIDAWFDALPGSNPLKKHLAHFTDTHHVKNGSEPSPDDTASAPIPLTRGPRRHHIAPSVAEQRK